MSSRVEVERFDGRWYVRVGQIAGVTGFGGQLSGPFPTRRDAERIAAGYRAELEAAR